MERLIEKGLISALSSTSKIGLAYPELQQYLTHWAGYFFWKQESAFSIDDHVYRRKLHPGEDLLKVEQEFLREPLPQYKSPWSILVVVDVREESR